MESSFHIYRYYPHSLDQVLSVTTGTCRLATSRYLPSLAEGLVMYSLMYSRDSGHFLEQLSTLKLLGDEEEAVSSDGMVKGVFSALNSSAEEQVSDESAINGYMESFSKTKVGLRSLDCALQS